MREAKKDRHREKDTKRQRNHAKTRTIQPIFYVLHKSVNCTLSR